MHRRALVCHHVSLEACTHGGVPGLHVHLISAQLSIAIGCRVIMAEAAVSGACGWCRPCSMPEVSWQGYIVTLIFMPHSLGMSDELATSLLMRRPWSLVLAESRSVAFHNGVVQFPFEKLQLLPKWHNR